MNIAERFASMYASPEAPLEPAHPFMELVSELRQAREAAEDAGASTQEGPSPPSMPASAEELEQRALAQVGTALERGRASEAKTLAVLADQLRKRAVVEREARRADAEQEEMSQREKEDAMMSLFGQAAYLAHVMLHDPSSAPFFFLRLIKEWREINLGEGELDAEMRAAQAARAHQHYVDGSWDEILPEYVREVHEGQWQEIRADLNDEQRSKRYPDPAANGRAARALDEMAARDAEYGVGADRD